MSRERRSQMDMKEEKCVPEEDISTLVLDEENDKEVVINEEELELVEKLKAGDQKTWKELEKSVSRQLFVFAMNFTRGNKELSRDVLQETFVRAVKGIENFESKSSLRTWLQRILTNLLIDNYRKAKNKKDRMHHEYNDALEYPSSGTAAEERPDLPEKSVLMNEKMEILVKAIDKLSPDHKEILELRELEGMPYEDIAVKLDIPLGTVMSRLFHARKNTQREYRKLEVGIFHDDGDH